MATHIYTSVAANYLPKARVLARSIKKFHPDFLFHVVLCDAVPSWFSLPEEPFDSLITLHDLGLENPEQWIFKHTLVELSTGVKGFALQKLLAIPESTEAVFLDPDIIVLSPLDRLLAEFANASILLTPHLAEPETDTEAILDNEFSVLKHGIFNLGFIGVKNSPEGRRFADWWATRLEQFCYDDIPRGIFTDQRWADLVPAYFSDQKILRDSAYNVCTWNLSHRSVTGSLRDGLLVNGEPLVFYHFSGFDSGAQQAMLDKYGKSMPALYELREWYVAECERNGQSAAANLRWTYGFFDNGERILHIHRKCYRERADLQSAFPNPFCARDVNRSFLQWFNRNHENGAAPQKTFAAADSSDTPDYRVFVLAAPDDAALAEQTLEKVSKRTVRSESIFFASGPSILSSTQIPDGVQPVEFESDTYEDLFRAVLNRFGDRDALLIRAGTIPPDKWDLRLAWSAVRQPGIATVFPIDERLLDKSGAYRSSNGDDLLDRLCYWHRPPADVEVASFSPDCVYVRANAMRDILSAGQHLQLSSLLDVTAKLRYTHVLATHICVNSRRPRASEQEIALGAPGSACIVRLHDRIRAHFHAKSAAPPAIAKSMRAANLHIMHNWGGGLERWVADYCCADTEHHNFILKSSGKGGAFGSALELYRHLEDREPLEVWRLEPSIKATVAEHPDYQRILAKLLETYGIQRIIISSLIGHSLDALRQPVTTVFVCHDYYPFCPALNITFGQVCRSCEQPRLTACTYDNPHNRFFANVTPAEWMQIRKEFADAVNQHAVTIIAPSPSVHENYTRLESAIAPSFRVIPHGTAALPAAQWNGDFASGSPLRVVMLGSLAPHKGGLLLESIVPELTSFCDLMLVGCGDYGKPYSENPKITVIADYQHEHLPECLAKLKPELGLLLSVVPETFSYTLRELQDLRVPVLATNIGSFADRIQDGVTGLLCAPEPEAILQRLKEIAADRQMLKRIHKNLETVPHRSAEQMLRDYERLHPFPYSPRLYFDTSRLPQPLPEKKLQLYWRSAAQKFEEEDSVIVTPLGCERQIIRLHLFASQKSLEQVRLDLSAQRGLFLLYDLSFRDARDRVLWSWDGDAASLKSIAYNQILFLQPRTADSPALLYFTDTDPYVILPIPAHVVADVTSASYVEIDFRLTFAEDQIGTLISLAATSYGLPEHIPLNLRDSDVEDLPAVIQYRDQQLHDLATKVSERDSRVRELERHIAGMENSTSWRVMRPVRRLAALGRRMKRALTSPAHSASSRVE